MKLRAALILFVYFALMVSLGHGQATTAYHRLNQVLARSPQGGVTAQIVPYATVAVTNSSTGLAGSIYVDPALTVPYPNSVVTADANGNYGYYFALQTCMTEKITYLGGGSLTYVNICSNTASSLGTVTSFSAPSGNWPSWLVPTVTNPTTTPSLAVAAGPIPLTGLATQAQDTFLGNATGGTAVPTAIAFPTTGTNGCAGATNALTYNTSTHSIGCNTISGSGTVTTTGSPASPELAVFSGATSITNGNLSGDATTSGTLAVTVVKVNGGSIPAFALVLGSNGSNQLVAASLQGTDSKVLTAGTVSGTSILLCTDANGGATTSSCPSPLANPMTTTGDIIVATTSGLPTRLGIGSTGQVLAVVGGTAAWAGTARTCNSHGCYIIYADGTIFEWGDVQSTGGGNGGTFVLTLPQAFTSTTNLDFLFQSDYCNLGSVSSCAGGSGGSNASQPFAAVETPSTSAPTIGWWDANTAPGTVSFTWYAVGH